jgi:hypothetical protein
MSLKDILKFKQTKGIESKFYKFRFGTIQKKSGFLIKLS